MAVTIQREKTRIFQNLLLNVYATNGSRKIPPGKIPTRKILTHQTPPWKISAVKFPPGIFPPISLIVFLHYFFL